MLWGFVFTLTQLLLVTSGWILSLQRPHIRSAAFATADVGQHQREGQQQEPTIDTIEQIASVATGQSLDDDILNAAAAAMQEKFPLLGTKSLGVDYGLVRTGIAVTVGYNPEPLDIFHEENSTLLACDIVHRAASLNVSQIVLGLPLHRNGTEAEQTSLTRIFARELAQHSLAWLGPHVPVWLWDERYTSKEAAARAHAKDANRPLYGTLDAEAACIILETYYNDNGVGAERIELTEQEKALYLAEYERRQEEARCQRQAILDQRRLNMNQKQEAMERARKLEEAMRAAGTLGKSNKSKKKKKATSRKREETTWILP